jgi:hypothetical protein
MSCYIVTLAEARADILNVTDDADDAALTRLIETLQGRFEDYCHRGFLRTEDVTETFDGGVRSLLLYRYPVESVASVHYSTEAEWDADTLLREREDYYVNLPRGRVTYYGDAIWPKYPGAIRVVYTGGYVAAGGTAASEQTAMPEGLRGLFLMQLSFEWRNRRNLGNQSLSGQGVRVDVSPAALLPAVRKGLDAGYRRLA